MPEEILTKEQLQKLQEEIVAARMELSILYEIGNAMRTTLKLDEILYIILTGVTAHTGLGFNRAMLFLVNEKERIIEGKMGIGPDTGEEADKIWKNIESEQMNFDDLINAYKLSGKMFDSQFNRTVTHLKISLDEKQGGLLAMAIMDGMPLHLTKDTILKYTNDPLLKILDTEELAIVPLKAKDKVNGIILADNIFTKKPITKDDMRIFIMLANQAGLAIENSCLYERTLIRSHTDSLTNLWNHGYFQFILQEELERAKALHLPLSLIMLDMDFFKVYNDTYGHQKGDMILEEIARIIKNYSRKMDYVCRYGGEEFAIILPQTSKKEAYFIAERLREIIVNHNFPNEETQPNKQLTASIGLATLPDDAQTKSQLIECADKLMYKAKAEGKNKTSAVLD
ncbi:MAG: sensor domain-containing diguanylate cyclase [Candidatus Omnitrophota bacterium]|nr:sensor domain-containing diguanylate cyclase [Candidatus Omnitrophota bacterium]